LHKNLFFFGDSICVGQHVSIEKTWVSKFSTYISKKYKNTISVHNRSINGCTSRQALERLQFDVLSQNPYYLVIQFGLNDANIWSDTRGYPRVSKMSYIQNIIEMIERSKCVGVNKIIINSNHPTTMNHTILSGSTKYYEDMNKSYYKELKKSLKDLDKIYFFDIRKHFKNKIKKVELSNYLLDDEIHLSEIGHNFYYKHFKKFFSEIIK